PTNGGVAPRDEQRAVHVVSNRWVQRSPHRVKFVCRRLTEPEFKSAEKSAHATIWRPLRLRRLIEAKVVRPVHMRVAGKPIMGDSDARNRIRKALRNPNRYLLSIPNRQSRR